MVNTDIGTIGGIKMTIKKWLYPLIIAAMLIFVMPLSMGAVFADTDYDISNYNVTFDQSYRVLDQIESTPYDDYFYIVPKGTTLEPIVQKDGTILTDDCYTASYSECKFYKDRNEWDKIDDTVWIDHFPTEEGVYFCKVEGKDPYTGSFEWIDLIRIYSNPIENIEIGITPPSSGTASIDADSQVDIDAYGVSSCSAYWSEFTGYSTSTSDTIDFVEGSTYYAVIFLTAKEGYTFSKGYSHDLDVHTCDYDYAGACTADNGEIYYTGIQTSTDPETMVIWVKVTAAAGDTCPVSFESNGGSGSMDSVNVPKGGTFKIPECGFTAPDTKIFRKWNTSADGRGTSYYAGDTVEVTEGLTLYAVWDMPYLALCSYDMTNSKSGYGAGGTFEDFTGLSETYYGCNNYSVENGKEYSVQAYPDAGYVFVGWYNGEYINTDADGNPVQDARPYLDDSNLLSTEQTYTFRMDGDTVICPVFKVDTNIANATVTGIKNKTYTGKALRQSPVVKLGDTTLKSGTDYTAAYKNNKYAGTASVIITGKGEYTGKITKTFKINKAANPLKVKAKTATLKFKKLKKKTQFLTVTKVMTFTNKGQGTKTYSLVSAKKGSKNFKKYFSVNSKTGKVTVKKKLAKGTYTVSIKVRAAGNKNYKAGTRTVKAKIKVK